MCDCNGKNIINSPHLKIYTIMAEYKAKLLSGTTYKGDFKIKWSTATQEELAYVYEDIGMTDLVEKLTTKTKDGSKKATTSKKSAKNKVSVTGSSEE